MTAQPKSKLMARLRVQRRQEGLVRVEVWVKPEHAEKVRRYAKRLGEESKP